MREVLKTYTLLSEQNLQRHCAIFRQAEDELTIFVGHLSLLFAFVQHFKRKGKIDQPFIDSLVNFLGFAYLTPIAGNLKDRAV
jgi:hypothetical protein